MCSDYLCLMALVCVVMLLVHDWAAWSMWSGKETGYCRTVTWELGYLGLVLSTFVLGGGVRSVTIGKCCLFVYEPVGGDRYFVCYGPQWVDRGRLATSGRCRQLPPDW